MADGVERFAALWMCAWAEGVWSNRNSTWMIRAKRVFNERVDGHEQGKMCIEDWTEKKQFNRKAEMAGMKNFQSNF